MGPILGFLLLLLEITLFATILTAIWLIIYARWNYGKLDNLGFPVVKPHFFLGSNWNGHNLKSHLVDLERSRTYGSIYGVYDGRVPMIMVSDPKLLRRIQSVDFDHFRGHRKFGELDHTLMAELLDFLEDDKWKKVRSILTPHFTTGKIKQMSETISEVSAEYVDTLMKENSGKNVIEIDFRKYLSPLLFEIIGKCFCGINIENARDPDNKFINALKQALDTDNLIYDWTYTLMNSFPFLAKFIPIQPDGALAAFDETVRGVLQGRVASGIKRPDMVNTLLEIFQKSQTDSEYKKLGITEVTAIAQAFEFFVASYEGTRTSLSMLTYYLAINPEVQERVLAEIDAALLKSGGKVNPESVSDLPFLTACLTETLRMSPGFIRPDRRCTKDWEHNGIRIKKGMTVVIPLWALHRDPQQYPDPETFEPERWMPERKEAIDTYAFNTFGQGPRACIGQRFSYEMNEIILVEHMKEFRIEHRPDTVFKDHVGNPLLLNYDPILVNLVRRK